MEKIFVAYGDATFKESLSRIKKQAKAIGRFDKILIYTPENLPAFVKASPLFAFSRGGGYWVWKPYIVIDALSKCQVGDVICYADAGCTLNPNSEEWDFYYAQLDKYNAIFFQYRDNVSYPGWEKFCSNPKNNSSKILYWMKPATIDYFQDYFGDDRFLNFSKIWGGCFFIKKTYNLINVITEWYNLALFHPILFVDPIGKENINLPETFNQHRHDQSVITPLIFFFKEKDNILLLPETAESDPKNAAIIASRYKSAKKVSLYTRIKCLVYKIIHSVL